MLTKLYWNVQSQLPVPPTRQLTGAASISFPATGHTYYGATKDLRNWFKRQCETLHNGRHTSSRLQQRWSGAQTVEFRYVPTATLAEAHGIAREQRATLRGSPLLLNETPVQLHSKQARAKMREQLQTDNYRAKAGTVRKALWATPEYRNRVMASRNTVEVKAKRASHWRRVSIKGEVYLGLTAAAEATGLSRMTINRRCNSPDEPEYVYLPPLSVKD